MQEKVIQIPFNKKFFMESCHIIWTFSHKKHIKTYLTNTCLGVFCLGFGLLTKNEKSFPVTLIVGGGLFLNSLLTWIGYVERRVKYFKRVGNTALRYEKESMDCTYTFSDSGLEYHDKEKSLKFAWSLFGFHQIFKDTIIFILKDTGTVGFTIARAEVGDSEYFGICQILKEKIK
jgi:hypothetical protein